MRDLFQHNKNCICIVSESELFGMEDDNDVARDDEEMDHGASVAVMADSA